MFLSMMIKTVSLLVVVLVAFLAHLPRSNARIRTFSPQPQSQPSRVASEVTNLPGLPSSYTSKVFSGYITVDQSHGRELFYMLTESLSKPDTDPLVMWLNGGPGCSSLGGLFSELGPFWPTAGGKGLEINAHSWNQMANVLFVESPAGVGFSFSKNTSDYTVGDQRTSEDLWSFMQGFLDAYPRYRNREFWISGESYGGHYVVRTAWTFVQNNKQASRPIPIKGFLVGNAWTVAELDNLGALQFWYEHALIANNTYQGALDNCDFSHIGPLSDQSGRNDLCDDFTNRASQELGNINIYDVYEDVCHSSSDNSALRLLRSIADSNSILRAAAGSMLGTSKKQTSNDFQPAPPCIDNYVAEYLNREDVQRALFVLNPPQKWRMCSQIVHYSRHDLLSSMLPYYRDLLADGSLRMLVYSGDVDGIVPVTGTRKWLHALDLAIKKPFRPWMVDGQVGGYVTEYHGLTFTTVRNAGHMVPGTQPARSLAMFSRFLNNQEF